MKGIARLFITVPFLSFLIWPLAGQTGRQDSLPQFLYGKFSRATVAMKNGVIQNPMMNYNILTGKMIFIQNGRMFEVTNPADIDTVFLENSRFVPGGNGFLELMTKGEISLFTEHTAKLESPGSPVGYGGTSQTVGPTSLAKFYDQTGVYNLRLPEGSKLNISNLYWIKKDGKLYRFNNKKQFLKLFPGREDEIRKFISQTDIDFRKSDDLSKLVNYCNTLIR